MDKILKAILFGGKAIVSVVDAKELTNKAINLHNSSDGASVILGRVLAINAFLCAGMKGAEMKLSSTISGNGKLGKIIVAGQTGGVVRGYVENPKAEIQKIDDINFNISDGIGEHGFLTVIKDFGLKEPYVGKTDLVKGDIDTDFAYYFAVSEQLPSAVSSGAIVIDGVCQACGCIVVQPMPNCEDYIITVLEDIVRNFKNTANVLKDFTPKEIIENNFGHFECSYLPEIEPRYQCRCSEQKMDSIVLSLGADEARHMVDELGMIEIHCDFCNKFYRYDRLSVAQLFMRR